ncbi:hypothetical protein [Roseimarinus sediminis]|uniref:hypothetical protein n=1 Tax=Roseimarinus sediminis TaxID=1610899 RepID=UPI003D1F53FE
MQTNIVIKEVVNSTDFKKFIGFPQTLYLGSAYYVPPLIQYEKRTLSPDKKQAIEHCKIKYWIALKKGEVVGRIAGIIDKAYNQRQNLKFARFGWLDFENDPGILDLLLDEVEKWAKKEEMEFVHGPLGFSSFDRSGLLIDGFDERSTFLGSYNYKYYPYFFEKTGYEKDIDWIEYRIKVPDKVPENIFREAELIKRSYGLTCLKSEEKRNLIQYADEIFEILNYDQFSKQQIKDLKIHFLPFIFIFPEYTSIIKDKTGKIIAFAIVLPSFSTALQKSEGKLSPIGLARILSSLHFNDTAEIALMGIDTNFQDKGINSLILSEIIPTLIDKGFKHIESNKQQEQNTEMQNLWNNFETRQHKRSRCYIKKV